MSAAAFGGATLMSPSSANAQSTNPYTYRRNWGRWGADDQKGAVNLITPAKRAAAAALVKSGRAVSLGRVFTPEQHYIRVNQRGTGNSVVDYYGFEYHGVAVTHVDALVHMWDRDGMWNGRDPAREIDTNGVRFGDVSAFGDGLITRGVLLDVPRYRKVPHVAIGTPARACVCRRAPLRVHVHGAAVEDRSRHRKSGKSNCDVLVGWGCDDICRAEERLALPVSVSPAVRTRTAIRSIGFRVAAVEL